MLHLRASLGILCDGEQAMPTMQRRETREPRSSVDVAGPAKVGEAATGGCEPETVR